MEGSRVRATAQYPAGNGPTTDSSGNATLWLLPASYTFNATPASGSVYSAFTLSNISVSGNQSELISLQYTHNTPTTIASLSPSANADGSYSNPVTVSFSAIAAAGYTIADTYYTVDNGSQQTYSSPFTVSGDGSHTITFYSVDNSGVQESDNRQAFTIESGLSAPTTLIAPTPTNQAPSLTWTAVTNATSYNIYRNGVNIGSSTTNSFTDTTLPSDGTYSYYVTAVNASGESSPSNTISVLADTTPPTITYTVNPIANSNNYNTGNVLVTFHCSDAGSGVATCTSPVTVPNEGVGQSVTGMSTDNAGNTATVQVNPSLLVQAVNAGGDAEGAYTADTGFSGGATYSTTAGVNTSNVNDPAAPQSVYQTVRYGNTFSYTFSNLTPNANYTLMMHFNELYWGTSLADGGGVGSRVFNVAVNAQSALANFDIYNTAGAANTGCSRTSTCHR